MLWTDPDYHKEETIGWGWIYVILIIGLLIGLWYGIFRAVTAIL